MLKSWAYVIVRATAVMAAAAPSPGLILAAQPGSVNGPSPAKSPPARDAKAVDTLAGWAQSRIDGIMKVLADGGDFKKAADEAAAVLDQCIAWGGGAGGGAAGGEALVAADGAVRMLRQLNQAPADLRRPLLEYLRANPALAAELAFALGKKDEVAGAYRVLDRLRQVYGDKAGQLPALAAAVCVVYDRPVLPIGQWSPKGERSRSEPGAKEAGGTDAVAKTRKPEPIDPVRVFGHFVVNQGRLVFSPTSLPPEILVYMVATRADVGELEWAFQKHAGDQNVGKQYASIVYDTAFFKFNKPKKIEALPYTLQNIAKVGGVCEEQAYYAAHVAKAVGVPATSIYGRSGDDAHAWVGFLQARGGSAVWNMDEGHYHDYENLEGMVVDPQTGERISDSQLAMTAEAARLTPLARHTAVALVDAEARLGELLDAGGVMPPAPEGVKDLRPEARVAGDPARLELLRAAIAAAPCCPRVWEGLMGVTPRMSSADRSAWFTTLSGGCGVKYPRYAYHIIAAMIDGIPQASEQSAAWDWAFQHYKRVPDLAADARLRQGKAWEKAGEKDRAFQSYTDIAREFPNDGPFVVGALDRAEAMLKKSGKDAAAAEMYKDAWRRISRPDSNSPAVFRQSNFYQVGERYAAVLERTGRGSEAQTVRRQLGAGQDKDTKR